jgi:hypothetical protein
MKIHDNVHIKRLSAWKGNEVNGIKPAPPEPEEIEGELHYEVDKILDSRIHGRWKKLQFLVKWKGYDEGHDSWENEEDVADTSKEAVTEFYAKHPSAPRKISASTFKSLPWKPIVNFTEVDGTSTVRKGVMS